MIFPLFPNWYSNNKSNKIQLKYDGRVQRNLTGTVLLSTLSSPPNRAINETSNEVLSLPAFVNIMLTDEMRWNSRDLAAAVI